MAKSIKRKLVGSGKGAAKKLSNIYHTRYIYIETEKPSGPQDAHIGRYGEPAEGSGYILDLKDAQSHRFFNFKKIEKVRHFIGFLGLVRGTGLYKAVKLTVDYSDADLSRPGIDKEEIFNTINNTLERNAESGITVGLNLLELTHGSLGYHLTSVIVNAIPISDNIAKECIDKNSLIQLARSAQGMGLRVEGVLRGRMGKPRGPILPGRPMAFSKNWKITNISCPFCSDYTKPGGGDNLEAKGQPPDVRWRCSNPNCPTKGREMTDADLMARRKNVMEAYAHGGLDEIRKKDLEKKILESLRGVRTMPEEMRAAGMGQAVARLQELRGKEKEEAEKELARSLTIALMGVSQEFKRENFESEPGRQLARIERKKRMERMKNVIAEQGVKSEQGERRRARVKKMLEGKGEKAEHHERRRKKFRKMMGLD